MKPALAPVSHFAGRHDNSRAESAQSLLGPAPGVSRSVSRPTWLRWRDVKTTTSSPDNVHPGGNGHPDVTALNSSSRGCAPVAPKDIQDA
jgi:hypothetical protein